MMPEKLGHIKQVIHPKNIIQICYLFNKPSIVGRISKDLYYLNGMMVRKLDAGLFIIGQGTRNEYRITRLERSFNINDLLVLVKLTYNEYKGFVISNDEEITLFLEEFNLNREDTNSLIDKERNTSELNFKPRAHILILLRDKLIKSPVMAIYELIKNSYDADARKVEVNFLNVSEPSLTSITIRDDGSGITEDILKNVWFEPGTDFRKPMSDRGVRTLKRSPLFQRIPMGEKGVGRFAVHKLGNKIKLITRPRVIVTDDQGYPVGEQFGRTMS